MVTIALSHLLPHTLGHLSDESCGFFAGRLAQPGGFAQLLWQGGHVAGSSSAAACRGAPAAFGPLACYCSLLLLIEQGCFISQSFCNPCCCFCYRLCLKALPLALAEEFWFSFAVISKDLGLLNFFLFQGTPGFLSSFFPAAWSQRFSYTHPSMTIVSFWFCFMIF